MVTARFSSRRNRLPTGWVFGTLKKGPIYQSEAEQAVTEYISKQSGVLPIFFFSPCTFFFFFMGSLFHRIGVSQESLEIIWFNLLPHEELSFTTCTTDGHLLSVTEDCFWETLSLRQNLLVRQSSYSGQKLRRSLKSSGVSSNYYFPFPHFQSLNSFIFKSFLIPILRYITYILRYISQGINDC